MKESIYPCISVIVPVFNAQRYLVACITSVLSQSYPTVELLLIDDGSTDDSGVICDAYCTVDSRVRVIHTENNGVCCARNTGIDAATGDLITFLDADDALLDDALMTMFRLLSEHKCDIVACTKLSFNAEGTYHMANFPAAFEFWSAKQGLEASLRDHPATYSVWGKRKPAPSPGTPQKTVFSSFNA